MFDGDTYVPGDYLVICDRCGFEYFASECTLDWQGWFVCTAYCYEPRHEQYTPPKPLGERQLVDIVRQPQPYNIVNSVDPVTLQSDVTPEAIQDGYFITDKITGDDL